ncbi:MAG: hypothetical protein KDC14_05395 [Planctomycetes bacterium]|nr:hypothetical protein [Planctomycetota bacterium]
MLDTNGAGATMNSIIAAGNITGPGEVRYYQFWYRDPGGVSACGFGSKFSNAVRLQFAQ